MHNPAYTKEWLLRQLPQQPVGPCAKLTVIAVIKTRDGETFGGTNACRNPQTECPRLPGEGYEKCHTICDQIGHAEVNALRAAGSRAHGGTLHVYGHHYACAACQNAAQEAGIGDLVVGGGFIRLSAQGQR